LQELSDKKTDSLLIEKEIDPSSSATALLRSPLGNLFFNNPSLLILPNLISFNTPIPFL